MNEQLRQALRAKLSELVIYSYSDGAVLFDIDQCTPEEFARLSSSGMLDTLARILADVSPDSH